jgi:hypothetical protein
MKDWARRESERRTFWVESTLSAKGLRQGVWETYEAHKGQWVRGEGSV